MGLQVDANFEATRGFVEVSQLKKDHASCNTESGVCAI
jgi:hypothetical protein